jgi:methylated-DNA-protein-cysteine methyltransferase related protein
MDAHLRRLYGTIYAVVRRIPRGRVATYGQVAELAGIPGGARVVGAAMRGSGSAPRLPWQRVVGKRGPATGRIAILDPIGGAVQRQLLEAEGVEISEAGAISLARYGWLPASGRPAATGSPRRGAPPRPPPRSGSRRRAWPSRR